MRGAFVSTCDLGARKAPMVGTSRETKVKTMTKLITHYELNQLTLAELQALYAELSQLLAETAFDTASRRNCLGSLENTIREINARFGSQWKLSVGP